MRKDRVLDRKAVVGPLVGEVLVGPDLAHDVYGLGEQLTVLFVLARVGVGMELGTLVGPDDPRSYEELIEEFERTSE